MKAQFIPNGRKDEILLTADSEEETEDLRRWDSCCMFAEFNHESFGNFAKPTLKILKEI